MDRICISAAATDIKVDLNITDQMIGYIFGIFALGYALFQIPAGWFADTYGPRKALTWVVALWSSFTALTGVAWNAVSMLVVRFLFGVGEAGAFPGATRAFYNWVPAKERGIANGFYQSGARAGAAISLLFMPWLINIIGWRMTFVANGAFGILWVIVWLKWFRNHPHEKRSVNKEERKYIDAGIEKPLYEKTKLSLGVILTSKNMLLAMFQYIASNITFFISFSWLLPYLISQYDESAGVYAPIPLLIGMFAHWISGGASAILYEKGFHTGSRRITASVGFAIAISGLLLCLLYESSSPLVFVLMFSIAVFGVELTVSPSWSFCMDIGKKHSGAVSASMNMFGNIGSAFSAVIFPYFVANISIPLIAPTKGNASSFFIFAAGVNLLAIIAWQFMDPQKQLDSSISNSIIRRRLIIIYVPMVLLLISLLVVRIFFP